MSIQHAWSWRRKERGGRREKGREKGRERETGMPEIKLQRPPLTKSGDCAKS